VLAPDEEQARALVRTFIGLKWGHMYDRKPEWCRSGRLAAVTTDGRIFQVEGVEPPTPHKFGTSDPEYYGHDSTEVVCARIEGKPVPGGPADNGGFAELGYDAEHVHHDCFGEAVALFEVVSEVDWRVMAGEFDWSAQDSYVCAVCEEGIL
jgi:hypothetical protein